METQVLAYDRASSLDAAAGRLRLETSGGIALLGPSPHPRFFDGFLVHPQVAGDALRQVAQLAGTTFVRRDRPPAGLDPVVTSDGSRLRFEAFSLCGGALARLDVLPEGLDGDLMDRGTTNVDVNEPLRRMLTRLSPTGLLHLAVGSDGLVATTGDGAAEERRVPLPTRWLRGFAEAQQVSATFEQRLEASAAEAMRFLSGPGKKATGWVQQAGRGWRLSSRPAPGSVHLGGSARLESLLPLLRHATTVRAYGPASSADPASSTWEVLLPGARYVLTLSPDPWRGFSGEGAALTTLTDATAVEDADVVSDLLAFQPRLEPDLLAESSGLSRERVRAALACLAVAGRVGYDVGEASYFHRELPYDRALVAGLNPRLRDAALVAAGNVTLLDDTRGQVSGSATTHTVHHGPDGRTTCTCEWWVRHRGSRGPCKHELAVRLSRGATVEAR